jgi:hypothetical protein
MNVFSETEPARLAQRCACAPLKRMGGLVSLPAANGLGLLVTRPWPGTDSRLCGAKPPACGGKHADENTRTDNSMQGSLPVWVPVWPRARGSLAATPRLADTPRGGIITKPTN